MLQPLIDFPQRLQVEVIQTMAAMALFANQAGLAKQA
jgi:hypothetical protein